MDSRQHNAVGTQPPSSTAGEKLTYFQMNLSAELCMSAADGQKKLCHWRLLALLVMHVADLPPHSWSSDTGDEGEIVPAAACCSLEGSHADVTS